MLQSISFSGTKYTTVNQLVSDPTNYNAGDVISFVNGRRFLVTRNSPENKQVGTLEIHENADYRDSWHYENLKGINVIREAKIDYQA